jgi:hypothetical protein
VRLAIAVLLLLASAAQAESLAYDEPAPTSTPPPLTKLGFRLGGGSIPLADSALAAVQLGIGVEHAVFGKLRMFAEYEWLWLSVAPDDPNAMQPAFTGSGQRTHLGVRRAFATKRVHMIRFYADVEAGGGLGLYDVPTGAAAVPHAFAGLRGGYQIVKRSARASRVLETELSVRAIVVEHGVGFGGGLGFYWGD